MILGWSERRAFLTGLALIVITNAIALGVVVYNRYGEPQSVLSLTGRELQFSPPGRVMELGTGSNGVDLHVDWRVRHIYSSVDSESMNSQGRVINWLGKAQLRALGFNVPDDLDSREALNRISQQQPRKALLVLEYDGSAYWAELARARRRFDSEAAPAPEYGRPARVEEAARLLELEEHFFTRLFVVDAGPDLRTLRARYPDRQRYAIVRGQLGLLTVSDQAGEPRLMPIIDAVDIDTIRVPRRYRARLDSVRRCSDRCEHGVPPFAATVKFGRRYEPWISDMTFPGLDLSAQTPPVGPP